MLERVNENKIETMYDRFTDGFLSELRTDEFFAFFMNAIKSGERNVYLYEKYIERTVDLRWVEMIEQTIIPLDTIIRNPRRFIKNEEEILPIEMVKNVTTESIRHLAQHTNMIATVKGDEVTPQRMLNIHKEESFETYENRFIYTLLQKLQYFLDKRLQALMAKTGAQDMLEMRLDGNFETSKDKIAYKVEFSYITPHVDLAEEDLKINADVSQLSSMQRVERIRRILYDFMGSLLIRTLEGCALVRPPLTMTNVLTKNQDFKKAVELWMFIERYEDQGYNVNQVEREAIPSEKFLDEMFSVIALQYVISKNNSGRTDEHDDYSTRRVEILPNIVRRDIEKIIENYDLEIEEVKRIFLESVENAQKNRYDDTAKVEAILARAMTLENTRMAVDAKHRPSRADRIHEKEERDRKAAEREAERKRIRNEFLEHERSRVENEVREKFEAIAKERDEARKLAEEQEAAARVEAQLLQEEADAKARIEAQLLQEEEDAKARVSERLAKEEEEAKLREAERLAKEEEEARIRETARLLREEASANSAVEELSDENESVPAFEDDLKFDAEPLVNEEEDMGVHEIANSVEDEEIANSAEEELSDENEPATVAEDDVKSAAERLIRAELELEAEIENSYPEESDENDGEPKGD